MRKSKAPELMLAVGKNTQMRKTSARNWSKGKEEQFLSVLAETCNVTRAASEAGVSISHAYRRRKADAAFRGAWMEAITAAYRAWWRVDEATVEELVIRLGLSRAWGSVPSTLADGGSHLPAPDRVAVRTMLVVLDLPDLGFGRHDVPTLQVAACQAGSCWRPIPIEVTSGTEVWTVRSALAEAVIGTAPNPVADHVDIELAHPDHWLESRDETALANGANLAALGDELIQFASAVPIGPQRFRLSGLRRGCRCTEWAMGSHVAGDDFVLISPGAIQEILLPPLAIGSTVSVRARGLADDDAAPVERVVTGRGMRPPPPTD